jgi:HEPN domain-containing protein
MKKITKEWLKAAQDDLSVIDKIIGDKNLTHIVAFHAQQCVEKCFKGIIEEHLLGLQKLHNLLRLYGVISENLSIDVDEQLLEELDKLYISARYPGDFGLLPSGKPTLGDAKKFYDFAVDVFGKTKSLLAKNKQ